LTLVFLEFEFWVGPPRHDFRDAENAPSPRATARQARGEGVGARAKKKQVPRCGALPFATSLRAGGMTTRGKRRRERPGTACRAPTPKKARAGRPRRAPLHRPRQPHTGRAGLRPAPTTAERQTANRETLRLPSGRVGAPRERGRADETLTAGYFQSQAAGGNPRGSALRRGIRARVEMSPITNW